MVAHPENLLMSERMLHFAQENDVRLLTVDQAKEEGIIGQNVFAPEPIPFKIRDLDQIAEPIIYKNSSQNKYSGEKFLSKRGERRKNARNTKRRF